MPFKAFANFSGLFLKNEIIGADDATQFYDAIESLGFGSLRTILILRICFAERINLSLSRKITAGEFVLAKKDRFIMDSNFDFCAQEVFLLLKKRG